MSWQAVPRREGKVFAEGSFPERLGRYGDTRNRPKGCGVLPPVDGRILDRHGVGLRAQLDQELEACGSDGEMALEVGPKEVRRLRVLKGGGRAGRAENLQATSPKAKGVMLQYRWLSGFLTTCRWIAKVISSSCRRQRNGFKLGKKNFHCGEAACRSR